MREKEEEATRERQALFIYRLVLTHNSHAYSHATHMRTHTRNSHAYSHTLEHNNPDFSHATKHHNLPGGEACRALRRKPQQNLLNKTFLSGAAHRTNKTFSEQNLPERRGAPRRAS